MNEPLAERLRPKKLIDYIGQKHLTDEKGLLNSIVQTGMLPSIILWGPPGVGKTSLAKLLSGLLKRPFYNLSAINSGVKDLREIIDKADQDGMFGGAKPILFIDEIHRFNKTQQDALLGAVEKGSITLVGATTENPSFEINAALLSRCQVYILKPIEKEFLIELLNRALTQDVWLRDKDIEIRQFDAFVALSGGDARKLLNALETVVLVNHKEGNKLEITDELVLNTIQQNMALYDKNGEMHYDIISAFIKSVRGSDPNAAIYWLAKMIDGGEDLSFIARRLVILAAEDIGLANPTALVMANTCFQTVNVIGYPESRIILSHCTIYLATSPKSNSAYMAIDNALQFVRSSPKESVPLHLRNAPTKLMKEMEYGKRYEYAHSFQGNFVFQDYLPKNIQGKVFYSPGDNAREIETKNLLVKLWKGKYNY